MGMGGRQVPPLGSQGNVWNGVSTGVGTPGNPINLYDCPFLSAFGNVSGACTITLMISADGTNWYSSGLTATTAGSGNFTINGTVGAVIVGAQYATMQSSANVTATATIQAKD